MINLVKIKEIIIKLRKVDVIKPKKIMMKLKTLDDQNKSNYDNIVQD